MRRFLQLGNDFFMLPHCHYVLFLCWGSKSLFSSHITFSGRPQGLGVTHFVINLFKSPFTILPNSLYYWFMYCPLKNLFVLFKLRKWNSNRKNLIWYLISSRNVSTIYMNNWTNLICNHPNKIKLKWKAKNYAIIVDLQLTLNLTKLMSIYDGNLN